MVSVGLNIGATETAYPSGMEEILIDQIRGVSLSSEASLTQRRIHSRYVREDISVWLNLKRSIFRSHAEPVELINISHHGIAISCAIKIGERNRLSLFMKFEEGKEYTLKGRVVHRSVHNGKHIIGIKFDKANRSFEEYLLKSGLKIKLRRHFE